MPNSFVKAKLEVSAPATSGSASSAGGGGREITFQFNPKELSIDKKANWKSNPAKGAKKAPPPEFTGTDPKSMKIEMFLDETESDSGDVMGDVDSLFELLGPDPSTTGNNKPTPPTVKLKWGGKTYFTAYVESVSAKFMKFKADGTPVRALVNLSLKEVPPANPGQNPTSGSVAAHRFHVMSAGDSLASIAYREYEDPTYWRGIAHVNNIENPMRIPLGTHLMLPPPEEAKTHI